MSQFQTSGPNPQYGTRRGPTTQVPRTGIVGSLSAPGLAAMPIDDRGAVMARQILNVIGGIGETAGMVGRMQEVRNREQMQIAREQAMEQKQTEREAEQTRRQILAWEESISAADKGTGVELAKENQLKFIDQIRRGEVVFDKPEDAAAAWNQMADTNGLNENQKKGWSSLGQQFVIEAYNYNNQKAAEAQASIISQHQSAIIAGELEPAQAKVLAGFILTKEGSVDQNAVDRFMLQTAQELAVNGDKAKSDAVLDQLSDKNRYVSEISKINTTIEKFKNNEQAAIDNAAWDGFFTAVNNKVPSSQLRDYVEFQRQSGVSPKNIASMNEAVDNREAQEIKESIEFQDNVAIEQFNREVVTGAMADAEKNVAYRLPETFEMETPSGKSHKITRGDVHKALIEIKQQQLIKQYPNSPDEQLVNLVEWAAKNAIPIVEIKERLKFAAAPIGSDTQTISPITAEGYRTYKLLRKRAPYYIDNLDIGDKTALSLYENAAIIEESKFSNDELGALQMASRFRQPEAITKPNAEEREKIYRLMAENLGVSENSSAMAELTGKNMDIVYSITRNAEMTANNLSKRSANMIAKANDTITVIDRSITRDAVDNWQGITDIISKEYISNARIEKDAKPSDFFLLKTVDGNYALVHKVTGGALGNRISSVRINDLVDRASKNRAAEMIEFANRKREGTSYRGGRNVL